MAKSDYIQNEAHDWLGECAENYVAYLFAKAGFMVYAGCKWGADLAVHDTESNKWIRIEVRSTDSKNRWPRKKPKENLLNTEFVVEVRFKDGQIETRIIKLEDGEYSKTKKIENFDCLKIKELTNL